MGWSVSKALDNLGKAITSIPDNVASTVKSATESVTSGVGSAASWVADKAPVAGGYVAEGFAHVGSVILAGPAALADKAGYGDNSVVQGILKRNATVVGGVLDFSNYVAENPKRAGALALQGTINGVTSTVGFVGDAVKDIAIGVTWDWTTRNVVNLASKTVTGAINLGRDDNDKLKAFHADLVIDSFESAFSLSEKANELGQIRKYAPSWTSFRAIDPADPNANYERTLLYGTQAIIEVPAFMLATAATGGAGGAAWASLRTTKWTANALGTLNDVKKAEIIARTLKIEEEARVAAQKIELLKAANAPAKDIASAEKKLRSIEEQFEKLGTQADKLAKTQKEGVAGASAQATAETTASATAGTGTAASSTTASASTATTSTTASASTATTSTAANSSASTVAANAGASSTGSLGGSASQSAPQFSYLGNIGETAKIGAYKGAKFGNPFEGGVVARSMEGGGVGLSYGLGVYFDTEKGNAEIAAGAAKVQEHEVETGKAMQSDFERRKKAFLDADNSSSAPRPPEPPPGQEINVGSDFAASSGARRPNGNSAASAYSADSQASGVTNGFNNGATAVRQPLEPGSIIITVTPELSRQIDSSLKAK